MSRLTCVLFLVCASVLGIGCWSRTTDPNAAAQAHLVRASTTRATVAILPTTVPASLRQAVTFLASDELEGRGVGTPGIDRAADYIADRFRAAHLAPPPGYSGYFQNFEMSRGAAVAAQTFLKSGQTTFILGKDYTPTGFSAGKSFEGGAVFVGYGISSEKDHYDDYAGADVKGKVAIAMRFEPHDAAGKSRFAKEDWSGDATLIHKAKAAAEHGAVALLLVNPPTHHGDADDLIPFAKRFSGETSAIPVIHIQRSILDAMLRQAKQPDLKTIQARIDETVKPESFAMEGVSFSGKIELERKTSKVKNVIACLPGTGAHADEYVVVGAHYDHLGRGGFGAVGGHIGDIYNGADDNASGTSAVLALADRFAAKGPPARSILFVTFTAEESGLIGSQYFVDHPPVPLGKIVAMLNLDMVGRVRGETLYVGGTGTAGNFESILRAADEGLPIKTKEFGKGGFGPSDHMTFAAKKIPVLFFFSGMHPDYHKPTDDVDKINFNGIVEVVDFGERVINAMAKMDRPQYVDTFDATTQFGGFGKQGGAMLGVIPDYGTDQSSGGVRISGTRPHSPAANAGMQPGDVIVQFGDKKIDNLYDLTDALNTAHVGDAVRIAVRRDGKDVQLQATLAERKPESAG